MSENVSGNFKLIKKTTFKDLTEGQVVELPESDLAIQNEDVLLQFKYHRPEEEEKYEIKPGIYRLLSSSSGVKTAAYEMANEPLLETIDNTSKIIGEARKFFNRLHVYEKRGRTKKRGVLLYSRPGMGKCLHGDTPVLMFDGTIKTAKEVETGDLLMGPDSRPRRVLGTTSGQENMYRITPTKGDPYVVNESHVLSLKKTGTDNIVNISVKDWLRQTPTFQVRHKGWRTGVEFSTKKQDLNPYFLGLWLGDGDKKEVAVCTADSEIETFLVDHYASLGLEVNTAKKDGAAITYRATTGNKVGQKRQGRHSIKNALKSYNLLDNKHIPACYLTGDRHQRLELLAGLIDSDGSHYEGIFDITSKSKELAEQILYLARSLGFAAYMADSVKTCCNSKVRARALYHRICISGDIEQVPTKVLRKKAQPRRQVKSVLRTGITVEKIGMGDYYGFELDGDHLFLLGDFTVTHNTQAIKKFCRDFTKEDAGTVVFVWPTSEIDADAIGRFLSISSIFVKECTRLILVIEDIGGGERGGEHGRAAVDSGLLELLDGQGVNFKLPTFIIATTNHPENLLASLADRPGRFDLMLELSSPKYEERCALMEFIAQRALTDEEKAALNLKGVEEFSIAHLSEIIIRADLDDKTYPQVIKELLDHSKKFKKNFEEGRSLGLGFRED